MVGPASPPIGALEKDITWNWFDVCIIDREEVGRRSVCGSDGGALQLRWLNSQSLVM